MAKAKEVKMSRRTTSSMAAEPSVRSLSYRSRSRSPTSSPTYELSGRPTRPPERPQSPRSTETLQTVLQEQRGPVTRSRSRMVQGRQQGESSIVQVNNNNNSNHNHRFGRRGNDPSALAGVGSFGTPSPRPNGNQNSSSQDRPQQTVSEDGEDIGDEIETMYTVMRERRAHRQQQQQHRPPLPQQRNGHRTSQLSEPRQQGPAPNRRRQRGPSGK